jgi:hypothetical protein
MSRQSSRAKHAATIKAVYEAAINFHENRVNELPVVVNMLQLYGDAEICRLESPVVGTLIAEFPLCAGTKNCSCQARIFASRKLLDAHIRLGKRKPDLLIAMKPAKHRRAKKHH